MLPLIIAGIVIVSVVVGAALLKGPTKESETVDAVRAQLRREAELAAMKQKNEQHARELEEYRKQVQEMAEHQKQQEAVLAQMMTPAGRGTKKPHDRDAQGNEKRKEKGERAARQKNKEEERELERKNEEKREKLERKNEEKRRELEKENEEKRRELERKMEELKVRECKLQEEVEKANQMAKQERQARVVAEKGFGPLRWPTQEEFQGALEATQYDRKNFHLAVVGRSGSGKSSLINAFRNLRNKDPGATPTGTKETTLEVSRYPDPGDQPPRQWMVWFDVPGAGTQRISHYDYFIKQGLYVFDIIVLAVGDRFEEIDVRILENCARFKIPAFIVRSKADMHILNSMKEYGDCESINDNPEHYDKCRDMFITETQQTISDELKRGGLPDKPVYIVSRDVLQRTYSKLLQPSALQAIWTKPEANLIHESLLARDLLTAAGQRRCDTDPEQTPLDWVKGIYSTAEKHIRGRNHEQPSENSDLADFFAGCQNSQSSRSTVPTAADIQKQPTRKPPHVIRKMIFPRRPTDAEKLYDEITQNDPELPNMLVKQPDMFTPNAAMLTFYPLAPIPLEIFAFGASLPVREYKEKEKRGKTKKGRGSHIQAAETEWTYDEGHKDTPAPSRGGANSKRSGRGRGRGGYSDW